LCGLEEYNEDNVESGQTVQALFRTGYHKELVETNNRKAAESETCVMVLIQFCKNNVEASQ
jgi:hypothetical protein